MPLTDTAIQGARWTGLGQIGSFVLGYLQLVVVAVWLEPDDFGLFGIAGIVIGLVQSFSLLGLGAAIVQRREVTRSELSSIFWAGLIVGSVLSAVAYAIAPLVAVVFSEPRATEVIRGLSPTFAIASVGAPFQSLLLRELRYRPLGVVDLAEATVRVAVAIGFAARGHGVMALVWAQLAASATRGAAVFALGTRRVRPLLRLRRSDLSGYLDFGLYQMASRIVGFLATRADQAIIGYVFGTSALGQWVFASNLVSKFRDRLTPIASTVAFPIFARVQDDVVTLRAGYLRVVGLCLTICAPLIAGVAALSSGWVPVFFGDSWSTAIALVPPLAFLALVRCAQPATGLLALARGEARLSFRFSVYFLLLDVGLVLLGVALGDLAHVAWSLLIGELLFFVVVYRYGVRPLVGDCLPLYVSRIAKPVAAAFVTFVVVALLASRLPFHWLALALEIGAGAIVFGVLTWLLEPTVFDDLWALVRRRQRAAPRP